MYADINGLKMFYEIRGTSDQATASPRCAGNRGTAG